MANFDVLKNFIKQRVYTNGTQAITGQIMQDTLLEMLKAWGYQFQGFATPETVPPATANDYKPYYLANVKGTYTNFGGAVLDGSTLAMLYYDGSWKSQVLTMGGGGGTGNFVTLNTEQTITSKKTFTAAPHFSPAGGSPFTVGNATVVNSLNADMLDGLHSTAFARTDQSPNVDLDTVNGFGIMHNATIAYATQENHYPIYEAGTLFYGNAAYSSANQIYGSYLSNRWFARGGGKNPTQKTSWREFVFHDTLLDNYVTLNTEQTITGVKTLSGGAASIYINNSDGSNASGLYWRNNTLTDTAAGIGALMVNRVLTHMYMGWGKSPWIESNNFCVASSYIKYKNNTVWHAGNDGAGSGLDADLLDGIHANGLFTALSNSGNYISMTIGGTTKTLVPAYATNAGSLGGNAPSYYATASGYVKKTGDRMTGTLTLDTIMSSAPYLTFSTRLYVDNATDTSNTTMSGAIMTTGGISAALSIWSGKNLIATGEVSVVSDIRTKSNIQDLKFRGSVRPVTFIKNKRESIGFIAQEVQTLYPELVMKNPDGILSLNYGAYTAVLQSQLDIHEDEISRLKRRVGALESENRELNRKLSSYGK